MENEKIKEKIRTFKSNNIGIHHYAIYLEDNRIKYIGKVTEDELEESA